MAFNRCLQIQAGGGWSAGQIYDINDRKKG
jgi:hypothetical protein